MNAQQTTPYSSENDFLNAVFVPIPDDTTQLKIEKKLKKMHKRYWELSQSFLKDFVAIQKEFMSVIDINDLRTI